MRARGGGDIRDLNSNSENWAVVKGALCAGLYPNLLHVDKESRQITSALVSYNLVLLFSFMLVFLFESSMSLVVSE